MLGIETASQQTFSAMNCESTANLIQYYIGMIENLTRLIQQTLNSTSYKDIFKKDFGN